MSAEQHTKSSEDQTPQFQSTYGLQVFSDLYLIEENEPEKYEGKLLVPDAFKEYYEKVSDRGVVVAKGKDTKLPVKLYDRVIFGRFSGQRFTYQGRKLQLVRECVILAIIS